MLRRHAYLGRPAIGHSLKIARVVRCLADATPPPLPAPLSPLAAPKTLQDKIMRRLVDAADRARKPTAWDYFKGRMSGMTDAQVEARMNGGRFDEKGNFRHPFQDMSADKMVAWAAIQSGMIAIATAIGGTLFGIYDGLEERFRMGRRFADGLVPPLIEGSLPYIARPNEEAAVAALLNPYRVLSLHSVSGPRGCGKSTLVHHVAVEHTLGQQLSTDNGRASSAIGAVVGYFDKAWARDPWSARRAFLLPLPENPSGVIHVSLTGDPREWVVQWALAIGINVTPSIVRQFFHKHFVTSLLSKSDIAKDPGLALTAVLQKTRDMAAHYVERYGRAPVLIIDNVNYAKDHANLVTHVVQWASACAENKVLQVVLVHAEGYDAALNGMTDPARRQITHITDPSSESVHAAIATLLTEGEAATNAETSAVKPITTLKASDVLDVTGTRMLDVELALDGLRRGLSLEAIRLSLERTVRDDLIGAHMLKPSDDLYWQAAPLLKGLRDYADLTRDEALSLVGSSEALARLLAHHILTTDDSTGTYRFASVSVQRYIAGEWTLIAENSAKKSIGTRRMVNRVKGAAGEAGFPTTTEGAADWFDYGRAKFSSWFPFITLGRVFKLGGLYLAFRFFKGLFGAIALAGLR